MSEKIQKTDISKTMPREKKDQPKPEKFSSPHGAEEKARAVLSLWAGRRRPGEVCREYGIKYTLLSHWEKRALEGMLQALEPRVRLDQGPALSPRLQALLEGKSLKLRLGKVSGRLEERLFRLQDSKDKKDLSRLSRENSREVITREPKEAEKKT
ncbi:MAG: helix-turn-helix domain-containing protein [Syntrophales bacterium]|nr:helix-turn-helix domain-containing protein [Syntrophales bacterium]